MMYHWFRPFVAEKKNRINSRAQKFAENSPTTKGRGKMVKFMFLGDPESGKTAIVTRWDGQKGVDRHRSLQGNSKLKRS